MRLKHHKDFPKKLDGSTTVAGELVEDGFNEALDICGEIEVLERLDEEKVREVIIEKELVPTIALDSHQAEWTVGESRKLAQAICQKFGTSKEG